MKSFRRWTSALLKAHTEPARTSLSAPQLPQAEAVPGHDMSATIARMKALREEAAELELQVLTALGLPAREVVSAWNPQSKLFMIECGRALEQLYGLQERTISVLDVGPRTASGTSALVELYGPQTFSRLKIVATAVDQLAMFKEYSEAAYPNVEYRVANVDDLPQHETWDVVIASHVIEHTHDPHAFLASLRKRAKDYVVIACPYEERDRIPGHEITIGWEFIRDTKPIRHEIYLNQNWRPGLVAMLIYPGTAA
jgi:SAM-dependent methyltransferase